jgi:DNA-binding NarL/FixJ family response regulator
VTTDGDTAPVRVLIVDDDPLVRAGLSMILGGVPQVRVVGEAADGDEVPAAVARCTPDVVLMDIRMPRVDGLAATEALRVRAVLRVAAGEATLSPTVTRQLISHLTVGPTPGPDQRRDRALRLLAGLTEREHEVAVALGHGRTNAEISAELFMSVATVKAYVSRLLTKLALNNRVQVALLVHDAGLV